ncbi:hypothetical protein FACS1894169_04970 [Bacteroidia bacterium]|nr:hypothetical protein FACS1894169_04970 [Bacteroidia bacterium]
MPIWGLILPRVLLTDLNKLSGGAAITGVSDDSQQDKDTHIGQTVYHVGDSPGVYSWSGSLWVQLKQSYPLHIPFIRQGLTFIFSPTPKVG